MSGPETLVTGGTGVLGRRVVERLSAAGVEAVLAVLLPLVLLAATGRIRAERGGRR